MIAELRTFVAIARLGTFAQAADRVGLTPAAVSGQIKRLEEHAGVALFDRTGRSATLNAAGARALVRAQAILDLFDVLADPATEATAGTLRIGAIASVQSSILANALIAFHDRYPQVGVHVVPGLSLHLVDQVDSGEMDLAVLIRPPFGLPPEIAWRTLVREPYVLLAHANAPGDDWRVLMQTQPFLRYHRLSIGGRQVERFLRSLPFAVTPAAEVPLKVMLTMVQRGLGVALVPLSDTTLPLLAGLRALPLGESGFAREIGYIRSQLAPADPIASHLAECLIAAVPGEPVLG